MAILFFTRIKRVTVNIRDAPNMLKNLTVIPSRTSPYYSLKYHLLFPNYSAQ